MSSLLDRVTSDFSFRRGQSKEQFDPINQLTARVTGEQRSRVLRALLCAKRRTLQVKLPWNRCSLIIVLQHVPNVWGKGQDAGRGHS